MTTQEQIDETFRARTLSEMAVEVHRCNVLHGWFDDTRTFGDGIALLHSEVSEALEAFREIGTFERTREPKSGERYGKPDDVGSEYADVLIRLLDSCTRDGIDLEREYRRKMAYNWTRPYLHGGKTL